MLTPVAPIANGSRTDHPYPGLPFVDDSVLSLNDPEAIERIGRYHPKRDGVTMWGRTDLIDYPAPHDPNAEAPITPFDKGKQIGGWLAFTTIPDHPDYAWFVRYHPTLGYTVELYRDADVTQVYSTELNWHGGFIYRSGGYCFDGNRWVRPYLVREPLLGDSRPVDVPGASSITAADYASIGNTGGGGKILTLDEFVTGAHGEGNWAASDLQAWIGARNERDAALPLGQCVVSLNAPELDAHSTVDSAGFAQRLGLKPNALRARLHRGSLPAPQGARGQSNYWSSPVVEHFVRLENEPSLPSAPNVNDAAVEDMVDDLMTETSVNSLRERISGAVRAWPSEAQVARAVAKHTHGFAVNSYETVGLYASRMFVDFTERSPLSSTHIATAVEDTFTSLAALRPETALAVVDRFLSLVRSHEKRLTEFAFRLSLDVSVKEGREAPQTLVKEERRQAVEDSLARAEKYLRSITSPAGRAVVDRFFTVND